MTHLPLYRSFTFRAILALTVFMLGAAACTPQQIIEVLIPTQTPIYIVVTATAQPVVASATRALPTKAPSTATAVKSATAPRPSATITRPAAFWTPTSRPAQPTANLNEPRIGKDGMVLLLVRAGEFSMGSIKSLDAFADPDEIPQHTVYIDNYWIDQNEVSNAQFARFLSAKGNQVEGGAPWLVTSSGFPHIRLVNGQWSIDTGFASHPVVGVTWYGANAYCDWAGRRLPTEAEWEKAARGLDGRFYPWGDGKPSGTQANFADKSLNRTWSDRTVNDGYEFTAPVGSYPAGMSVFKALDMSGNVWEWVADFYDEAWYSQAGTWRNPTGPSTGTYRVARGGGWANEAVDLRAADRYKNSPINVDGDLGFRCAWVY